MEKPISENNSPDPGLWLDLYGDALYRYAFARVSHPQTAEDLVQEALIAALQAYDRFEGRAAVKTWLIAILKRKIVDYFRRMFSRGEVENLENHLNRNVEDEFDGTGHWQVMPYSWGSNPEKAYERKEFMDTLSKCLAAMPERLANIFMLREFEELGTQAICAQLGISEANSWVMLYRARMKLRQCIEHQWAVEREKQKK